MVDVNNCSRKRRNSEETFEINNDEVSICESSKVGQSMREAKMVQKEDVVVNNAEYNLRQDIMVNNLGTTKIDNCPQERLAILQEENIKLKKELQEVLKVCKCNVNINIDRLSNDNIPIIMIKFHNQVIAQCYKSKFLNFLKSFKEFTHVSDDLEISVRKSCFEGKELEVSPDSNRKRKRKKSTTKELFILDRTPSLVTKQTFELKYTSKYTVQASEKDIKKQEPKAGAGNICFNCKKKHNLRDCPEPKDYTKINAARQKMKALNAAKTRYHLEEQKYTHLYPGKVSVQLKEALGVRSNELPPYIYRMRRIGYPPGWIINAKVEHSNLSLYDLEGKECLNGKNKSLSQIDVEKIIEYPGFNMPMEPGTKDDYRPHDCPPFSERYSKDAMITYLKESYEKEKDNNETCDMDIDQSADESLVPPGCEVEEVHRSSPSLVDLEQKKLELLAELVDGSTSTDSEDKKDTLQNKGSEKKKDVLQNIGDEGEEDTSQNTEDERKKDTSQSKDEEEEKDTLENKSIECVEVENAVKEDASNGAIQMSSPTDTVKLSMFGTPIIQSSSPYCRLPHPDKFSQDISPVINFENLPNSTGKYEQMTVVLQKIRKTLKNINDKS